jgi:glycosyl-4,4'-diaponeurosporenoate acyltransferase
MLPVVDVADPVAVAVDVAVWIGAGIGVGYAMNRRSPERLRDETWLTRPRAWERGGGWYVERMRIRRWKRWLPDAGAVFAGGRRKADLVRLDAVALDAFAVETRRAELTHWYVMAALLPMLLWNPPVLMLAMVGYALAANLPCIAVQRYNRARVIRIGRRTATVG